MPIRQLIQEQNERFRVLFEQCDRDGPGKPVIDHIEMLMTTINEDLAPLENHLKGLRYIVPT